MHHRLRIELGLDVPAFVLTYPEISYFDAGPSFHERPLYVLPISLAANWTF